MIVEIADLNLKLTARPAGPNSVAEAAMHDIESQPGKLVACCCPLKAGQFLTG